MVTEKQSGWSFSTIFWLKEKKLMYWTGLNVITTKKHKIITCFPSAVSALKKWKRRGAEVAEKSLTVCYFFNYSHIALWFYSSDFLLIKQNRIITNCITIQESIKSTLCWIVYWHNQNLYFRTETGIICL